MNGTDISENSLNDLPGYIDEENLWFSNMVIDESQTQAENPGKVCCKGFTFQDKDVHKKYEY